MPKSLQSGFENNIYCCVYMSMSADAPVIVRVWKPEDNFLE